MQHLGHCGNGCGVCAVVNRWTVIVLLKFFSFRIPDPEADDFGVVYLIS